MGVQPVIDATSSSNGVSAPDGDVTAAALKLDAVAKVLERTYRVEAARQSGLPLTASTIGVGTPRLQPVWFQIARKVVTNGWDPELFIRRVFHGMVAGLRPPGPRFLLSRRADEFFRTAGAAFEQELAIALRSQTNTAACSMTARQSAFKTPQDVWTSVLHDSHIPLSALFRYSLAIGISEKHGERFVKAAAWYLEPAAMQYMRDPEVYDRIWGAIIPPGFPAEARRIYARIVTAAETPMDFRK